MKNATKENVRALLALKDFSYENTRTAHVSAANAVHIRYFHDIIIGQTDTGF